MKLFIISLLICSCLMTVVSIIYMALSSSLKNWSAKRRYNLWLFILLGFLTPFKPFISDHLWKITLKAEEASTTVNTIALTNASDLQSSIDLTEILFAIWVIGAIIFAIKSMLTHYRFKRYLSRCSIPCDNNISELTKAVAKQMRIKKINVVRLKGVDSPMMTGLRHPTVILPECDYSEEELRLIIKHELYHFKKRDLLYKAIFIFCKMIHWFNPVMAVIEREIESICELACDERVIRNENKKDRKTYCQAILNTASLKDERAASHAPVLSSNFVNDRNNLKHRLTLIIANTKKKRFTFFSVLVMLLTVLSGTVFGVTYDNSDISYSENEEIYKTTVVYIPTEETSIPRVTDRNGNVFEDASSVIHLEETTKVSYSEQAFMNDAPTQKFFADSQTTNQNTTTSTQRSQ